MHVLFIHLSFCQVQFKCNRIDSEKRKEKKNKVLWYWINTHLLLYRWDTSVYFHIMTNMFLPLFHQLLYFIFSENLCIWLGIAVNLVYPSTCQRIKKWNRPYLNRIYSIGSYLSILAHPKKKKKKKIIVVIMLLIILLFISSLTIKKVQLTGTQILCHDF